MTEHLSLAALAETNVDDVVAITSRVWPAGIARVRGKAISAQERESNKENEPPLFIFTFTHEILSYQPTDKKVDPETLNGRDLKESYTIWPKDLIESIGLLKGRYQKAGIPNSGMPMGGVEGKEPGWMDLMVNHEFDIKIGTYKGKDGETRNRFDWVAAVPEA